MEPPEDRKVVNLNGEALSESTIDEFKSALCGRLLRPGDDGYDASLKIFNAMINKRPGLIVKVSGVADVIKCVNFAEENHLLLAVKGGGHNVTGAALCDGGIVIDFSDLKGVWVDPKNRKARVEPGATAGDVLHETQVHGLAVPTGVASSAGIAGLTLGGGFGWLAGKYGLSLDNLTSADVVTADGRFLTTDSTQNEDLFWALRGGGGNFGVVTSLEYKLHPVDDVLAGVVAWPMEKAREVLKFFRKYTADKPDELGIVLAISRLPDTPAIVVPVCYVGPEEEGERALEPLRQFGPPSVERVKKMKYEDVVHMLDISFPSGMLDEARSGYFHDLTDEMIETLLRIKETAPSPLSLLYIEVMSGEVTRKSPTETAFPTREKLYNLLLLGVWQNLEETDRNRMWVQSSWQSVQPFLTKKAYVNYLSQEGEEREKPAYGENYERLVELKRKYDPSNFFTVNQNIRPT